MPEQNDTVSRFAQVLDLAAAISGRTPIGVGGTSVNDNWVKGAELARADALKPVSVVATAEWQDVACGDGHCSLCWK